MGFKHPLCRLCTHCKFCRYPTRLTFSWMSNLALVPAVLLARREKELWRAIPAGIREWVYGSKKLLPEERYAPRMGKNLARGWIDNELRSGSGHHRSCNG